MEIYILWKPFAERKRKRKFLNKISQEQVCIENRNKRKKGSGFKSPLIYKLFERTQTSKHHIQWNLWIIVFFLEQNNGIDNEQYMMVLEF